MSDAVKAPIPLKMSPFQGFLPFFWLALAFTGGILLADVFAFASWVWGIILAVVFLILILALVLPKSIGLRHFLWRVLGLRKRLPVLVTVAFCIFGGWRYAAVQPIITPAHSAYYNDRGTVQLVGTLIKPPDQRDKVVNLLVDVDSLFAWESIIPLVAPDEISGLVLVQVSPGDMDWQYGDRVQMVGKLQTPSENADFSYRTYLARQGIFSTMSYARLALLERNQGSAVLTWIYALGDRAHQALQMLFPSPESDLLSGILLGREQGLSPDLQAAFRRTGTTHIIAISGFNMAILAGLFASIFTRLLGRKGGALAAAAAISAYTILVGADAAVVRAAIMGALGVLGGMFGRRQNGLNSLGIAALAMALADPNVLWDIGFQLSIAATLGLVLYAQPLSEGFIRYASRWIPDQWAARLAGPVGEFFLFTLAAQVMTLPVMAYHFGGISWLAFLVNPLILPPQPLVMILGGLAMLAGMLLPGLGRILAVPALPFVRYTIRMVQFLGGLPGGEWVFPDFNVLWLVLFYAVLFFLTLLPAPKRQALLKKAFSYQAGLLLLAGLVVFVWNRVLSAPDGRLHLTLLDESGTVLIQTPSGGTVLVGGGSRPSQLNQALGQMLPAGHAYLDVVLVATPARDDLNALSGAFSRTPPEWVLWGVDPEATSSAETLFWFLEREGMNVSPLSVGNTLHLGDGVQLTAVWLGDQGGVFELEWQNFSAALPSGRVDGFDWEQIPTSPDVLLLPDGLDKEDLADSGALPLALVNRWSPDVVFLSLCTADLPLRGESDLIQALADYPVLTTVDHSWVRVSTDGAHLWAYGRR